MGVVRTIGRASGMVQHQSRIFDLDILELLETVLMGASTLLVYCFNYDTQGIGNSLTNLSIAGFIVIEVIVGISRRSLKLYPTVALFALFTGFCLCSILWSTSFDKSFSRVQSLLLMLAYYFALTNFVLVRFENRERLYCIARILVISSLFAAMYLLFTSDWQVGLRVNGIIGDSNQASAYLAYSIPVALYCGSKKLLPKIIIAIDIIAVIVAIGVMGSRTGILVAAIGIVLYWLTRSIQNGIFSLRTIFVALAITFASIAAINFIMTNEIAYEIIGRRFESLFDILSGGQSKINENSYYERRALFHLAVELFSTHPIFGVGIDAYSKYAAISIRDTFSHNDYLQLLSCVGVIGFALYYAQHAYLVFQFRRLDKREFALCLTLLTMILIFHSAVVFYYQKLEFVFLALLLGVVSTNRTRPLAERDERGCQVG